MNQFIKYVILFLLIIFFVYWFGSHIIFFEGYLKGDIVPLGLKQSDIVPNNFEWKDVSFKYYFLNFLLPSDFQILKECLKKYKIPLEHSKENFYNVNRCNYKLPYDKNINNLLIKIINKIENQTGLKNLKLYHNTGIEYRKYQPGSFMDWHQDIILSNPPQWECVFTINNNSDSITEFEDGKKIQSKNNSLIMVKAGGLIHRVTMTTKGERYFLKFAIH